MKRALLFVLCAASVLVPALALAEPTDEGDEDGRPITTASGSASGSAAPQAIPSAGASGAWAATSSLPSASASSSARARIPFPRAIEKDGMMLLPGGRFSMGASATDKTAAPNERPAHTEVVAPFSIDKLEVTVGDYKSCVDKHACPPPAKTSALCTYDLGDPLLPMSCVRWADASAYCRSAGKRLPREAEWEFAARGGSGARYPWGGGSAACAYAATLLHESTGRSCTGRRPSRVGTHPQGASAFGVQDMSGNVEEWTQDFYVEHVAEGAAPRSGASHVLRGGGWLSAPSGSKTTSRDWGSALEAGPNVGFRCAKDVDR
jgi:formylglycine-generating enzyme required for sulfatase activity